MYMLVDALRGGGEAEAGEEGGGDDLQPPYVHLSVGFCQAWCRGCRTLGIEATGTFRTG